MCAQRILDKVTGALSSGNIGTLGILEIFSCVHEDHVSKILIYFSFLGGQSSITMTMGCSFISILCMLA